MPQCHTRKSLFARRFATLVQIYCVVIRLNLVRCLKLHLGGIACLGVLLFPIGGGAQPTISYFSPASGNVGASVTITGTNFNTTAGNNIVWFGAAKATVSSATATSLTVVVPADASYAPLTVCNTSTHLTATSRLSFFSTYSNAAYISNSLCFSDMVYDANSTITKCITASDLDGDGKADIIGGGTTSAINILRNTSSSGSLSASSFATPVSLSIISSAARIKVADIDGDGKPDIIVCSSTFVSVFRNTATSGSISSSSFASRVDFNLGATTKDVSIADFDGDGKPDLAVATSAAAGLSVLRNTSTVGSITSSSFASAVTFTAGTSPQRLVAVDIDGDGKKDIAVANRGSGFVSVLRNTSSVGSITSSSFAGSVNITSAGPVQSIFAGDVNGDGNPDLVVADTAGGISVFKSFAIPGTITTSSFPTRSDFSTADNVISNSPYDIDMADIDGDGKADILVTNEGGGIEVFRNTTSFAISLSLAFYPVENSTNTGLESPLGIFVGDLDGDGKPDVITANSGGGIGIFRNNPLPTPPAITSLSATHGNPGSSITITGTNFNSAPANNTVYFGAAKATVTSASTTSLVVTVPSGATYQQVSVNNTALRLTGFSQYAFMPTFNNSAYLQGVNFDRADSVISGSQPNFMAIGDIDGDGYADVVAANESAATISVFRNTSSGSGISFATKIDFYTGITPSAVSLGDLDGDGRLDIAVMNKLSGTISIFRNTATAGSFTTSSMAPAVNITATAEDDNLAMADFDGDGKPDIIDPNLNALKVFVHINTSSVGSIANSSFVRDGGVATGIGPRGLAIGDIDGDGKQDIVVSNEGDNHILVIRNTSTPGTITSGSFANPVSIAISGINPTSVAIGDLNADGKPEIVVGQADSTVEVFQNSSTSGTIVLASAGSFSAGLTRSIAISDIDGDGKPDIVTANYTLGTFSVLRNTSSSTSLAFASPVNFTVGASYGISVGDLNNDGKPDVVVSSHLTSGQIFIFRNNPLYPITGSTTVCAGATLTLSDSTANGTWSSSSTGIASVNSATGVVSGIAAGTATISYTVPGGHATYTVTVMASPVSISGSASVCAGSTTSLSDATSGGTWSSSNTALATVGSTGLLGGVATGHPIITYKLANGCDATMTASVNPIPGAITGINIVCIGTITSLSNSLIGGTWSSSNTARATIGSSGIVTGVSTGTLTISYTSAAGCISTKIVTVSPAIGAITGPGAVCIGNSITLSDTTSGGTWTDNGAVLVVSGSVTGYIAGTGIVTYTVASNSCYVTKTITVNTSPSAISGTTSACQGSTTTLMELSSGGTWSSSNTAVATVGSTFTPSNEVVTGVAGGTLTISYILANGCLATSAFTVNPLPVISGTYTVCAGATKTLSSSTSGGTWNSSASSVATVGSSTGIVSGVAAGTASISYTTAAGCIATKVVTVMAGPAAISGPAFVCTGATITVSDADCCGTWSASNSNLFISGGPSTTITGTLAGTTTISYTTGTSGCAATRTLSVVSLPTLLGGNSAICAGAQSSVSGIPSGGIWSSSNTLVATIGTSGSMPAVTGVSAGTTLISYTYNGCPATGITTVNALPASISGTANVCTGTNITLSDATAGGTWSSSNTAVAIAGSSTGIISGVAAGTSNVTYKLSTGCITTRPQTVISSPGAITGTTAFCVGITTPLTDATTGGTWSSANTSVATMGTSTGVVGGASAGTALISYKIANGCAATEAVTVNPLPAAVTGVSSVCTGLSISLSCATGGGAWNSGNAAIATVDATGVVTGVSAGTAMITYTLSTGCTAAKTITVNATPAIISGATTVCLGLTTTLSNSTSGGSWSSNTLSVATVTSGGIVRGVSAGTTAITYALPSGCLSTRILTVNVNPSAITGAGSVCAGSSITLSNSTGGGSWTSGNSAVATINPSGSLTGVSAGSATISYTLSTGCAAGTAITVKPLPSAISGALTVCAGLTTNLSNATSGGTWSSGNTSVTTINISGITTGVSAGTSAISYTLSSGCTTAIVLTVNATPAAITGPSSVCSGSVISLVDVFGGGSWSSNNTAVASVDAGGNVTGLSAGSSVVTYALPTGCLATATVSVNPLPGSISGIPAVCVGGVTSLSDISPGGIWSSSNASLATVTLSGIVYGAGAGNPMISYTLGTGCIATVQITVNAMPASILGTATTCAGSTMTLSDATAGGTWSSSNTLLATVDTAGTVNAIAVGVSIITYTLPTGCSATKSMTILATPASISGPVNVCAGSTAALSDATTGGTWSSSNTAVTTIGLSSGLATGVATGTAMISYTSASGCIVSQVLTVNTSPGAITGISGFCQGAATILGDSIPGGVWICSNTSVATIDSFSGNVSGVAAGTTIIDYILPAGCEAATSVTINPLPSAGTITGPASVCSGSSVTLSSSVAGGVWSSNNSSAMIGTASGVVIGVSAGTDTIVYTYINTCGSDSAKKTIAVIPLPVAGIITGTSSVCVAATVTFADSVTGGVWSSLNLAAAISSASGDVTGVTAGVDTILYSYSNSCGTAVATAILTVNPLPVSGSIVGAASVCEGAVASLSETVPGGVWSCSNANATIDSASGLVAGVIAGVDTVMYSVSFTCGTSVALKTVTVNQAVPAISGSTAVCVGSSATLSNAAAGGTWSSSNTALATVNPTFGVVSGISAGTSVITYALATGCMVTAAMVIEPLPSPITGASVVGIGMTANQHSSSPGGTWSSSNTAVVTIDVATGLMAGVTVGSCIVSYTLPTGCFTTRIVNVIAVVTGISGPAVICVGTTAALNYTIGGGTWSSGNTSVATVGSASGIVTGMSVGTASISYTLGSTIAVTTIAVDSFSGIPSITALSVYTGSAPAVVTISGANFNANPARDIVYFGAEPAVVSVANNTSLTVTVPVGATYSPVTVNNSECALMAYSQFPFLPVYDNTSYVANSVNIDPKIDVASGESPNSIVIADFDGDGEPDMAVANYDSNMVSIYRNTGAGGTLDSSTFASAVTLTTGVHPYCIAAGDVDGDGRLDIVVTNNGSSTVSIFRNISSPGAVTSASFAAKVDFATGNGPIDVAIRDIDGDGKPELAVVNYASNTVSVYRNLSSQGAISSSSFAAKVDFTTPLHPFRLALGDLDGDGKPDMTVVNQGTATVSVFRNTATTGAISGGSFAAKVDFATGPQPFAIALGDVDGDGKTDVIVANSGANTVSVFRNKATSGSFASTSLAARADFATGNNPYCVAVADINGDGKQDLIVSNYNAATISVLRNTATSGIIGAGSFAGKVDFRTGSGPRCVAVGDLDGDGLPDCAVANVSGNSVSLMRNDPLVPINGIMSICDGAATTLNDGAGNGIWSSGSGAVATVDSVTGVVTGVSAGTAQITYSLPGGKAIASVTVNALPSAGTISGPSSVSISGGSIALNDTSGGGAWSSSNTSVASVSSAGVVIGTGIGVATISYTVVNAAACSATASKNITVGPAPPSGITANQTVILCEGTSATLHAAVPGGLWSVGNTSVIKIDEQAGTVAGLEAGRAIVTYTVPAIGSPYVEYAIVVVNSIPKQVAIAAEPGLIINAGEKIQFTASCTGTESPLYQWQVNGAAIPGATSAVYSTCSLREGDHVICSVETYGCAQQMIKAAAEIHVSVGHEETPASENNHFCIAPNPGTGKFVITGTVKTMTDGQADAVITDISGKLIFQTKLDVRSGHINSPVQTGNVLPNGNYLVCITAGDSKAVLQIVIDR